jgi:hypothetical protein
VLQVVPTEAAHANTMFWSGGAAVARYGLVGGLPEFGIHPRQGLAVARRRSAARASRARPHARICRRPRDGPHREVADDAQPDPT